MSRVLAAALAVAAARGAAAAVPVSPTLVLTAAPALGGAAPGAVSYESVTQSELVAGLLRASGAAPAQQAGWEARHWPAGQESPELLAVLSPYRTHHLNRFGLYEMKERHPLPVDYGVGFET